MINYSMGKGISMDQVRLRGLSHHCLTSLYLSRIVNLLYVLRILRVLKRVSRNHLMNEGESDSEEREDYD